MSSLEALFDHAAANRRHGAGEIERRLIGGLLQGRSSWTEGRLASGAHRLLIAQPAMANLRNLARVLVGGRLAQIQRWLEQRAELLVDLDRRFAASAWPMMEGAERIVTISRSSAVAAVLEGAWRRGWKGETVVFDGLPAGSGAFQVQRLAGVLEHLRVPPDSTMSEWLRGKRLRVVVGADAVSPRRLVNAGGTRKLLELAGERSVPAAVVADTGKDLPDDEIDVVLESGPEIFDEETRSSRPVFEAISMDLVSMRISE